MYILVVTNTKNTIITESIQKSKKWSFDVYVYTFWYSYIHIWCSQSKLRIIDIDIKNKSLHSCAKTTGECGENSLTIKYFSCVS